MRNDLTKRKVPSRATATATAAAAAAAATAATEGIVGEIGDRNYQTGVVFERHTQNKG